MKKIKEVRSERIMKRIESMNYYGESDFIRDLESYYHAATNGTLLYNVAKVSSNGTSRTIKINYLEKSESSNRYFVYNFWSMLKCLGFRMSRKYESAVCVSGCGMDMVFDTHYRICSCMQTLGMIDEEEFRVISQTSVNRF